MAKRQPWTCSMTITHAKTGEEKIVKGRTFIIDGLTLPLYPCGALLAVLGRSHKCLYKWEKTFGFPRAMYNVTDSPGTNRWYSGRQIKAIGLLYLRFGRLEKKRRGELGQFILAVRDVFWRLDMPAVEREK